LRTRIKDALRIDRADALLSVAQVFITFALVTVAWVFFRAANVSDGFYIVRHMPSMRGFRVSQRPFRWACTYACVFATIFFGVFGHITFIYFQF